MKLGPWDSGVFAANALLFSVLAALNTKHGWFVIAIYLFNGAVIASVVWANRVRT